MYVSVTWYLKIIKRDKISEGVSMETEESGCEDWSLKHPRLCGNRQRS